MMFSSRALVVIALSAAGLAADASYRTLASASAANANWMFKIPDSRPVSALSIPGTHDSLAIIGGSLTECQENYGESGNSLTRQLEAGIRFFDVRVRVNTGNTFTIHHGAVYLNANFDDVLNKFDDFLAAHPTEAIFMRLKAECTGSIGSCTDASGQADFTNIFDSYVSRRSRFWAPSVDRNSAAAIPTMGTVRGRIVLAVLHNRSGGRTNAYGLAQFSGWNDGNSQFVQDSYNVPNTGAIATKRDQVRRFLDKYNAEDPGMTGMYVNFASGSSLFAQPYAVAGGAGGTQGVNPFLLIYLGQGIDVHAEVKRTGVVMMDFPGGGLIDKILTFNPL